MSDIDDRASEVAAQHGLDGDAFVAAITVLVTEGFLEVTPEVPYSAQIQAARAGETALDKMRRLAQRAKTLSDAS